MEFMDIYTNPSRFDAAAFPAMAIAPNELMEDWINTLESAKIMPCNPAGTPSCKIRISLFLVIRKREGIKR